MEQEMSNFNGTLFGSQLNVEKTNLIINYLPQTLTDEEFCGLFETIGRVKSARIIRNRQTNYSYGFGFVNYYNLQDAETAISKLNGLHLQHKRIKVAFSRPHSSAIKKAKLYIKNVPLHYTERDLESQFSQYGKIIQCRLLKNDPKKIGVAFILYDLHEQAEKAIENLNGVLLDGALYPLQIKYATDNKNRSWSSGDDEYSMRQDYYTDASVYDSHSYSEFRSDPFLNTGLIGGPIRNNDFSKNNIRYNPLDNQYLKSIETDTYKGHSSQQPNIVKSHVLFVYNIGPDIGEDALYSLFVKYGPVLKAQVVKKGNMSRGYAFVTMNDYEDAVQAIQALNGFNFHGKNLQVNFKR